MDSEIKESFSLSGKLQDYLALFSMLEGRRSSPVKFFLVMGPNETVHDIPNCISTAEVTLADRVVVPSGL